jgi:nucleoside-diphosphate-sugar epimerase
MTSLDAGARVLVTGASGFIGANLVRRLLERGVKVHAAVRATSDLWRLADVQGQISLEHVDVQDAGAILGLLARIRPEAVFNLATWRAPDPDASAHAVNVGGLLNLLHATAQRPLPIVHFASSLEYGPRQSVCREDDPLAPTTTHGITKAAAVEAGSRFAVERGLPLVVLRLFHVYGPFDRPSRFVPQLISAALEGHTLRLTAPGLRHDWIHVDDVVEAAMLAVTARPAPGGVLNVASGRHWTNEEMVAAVEKCSARTIRIDPDRYPARAWDGPHWTADTTKAREVLGWSPKRGLPLGLTQTIAWHAARDPTDER